MRLTRLKPFASTGTLTDHVIPQCNQFDEEQPIFRSTRRCGASDLSRLSPETWLNDAWEQLRYVLPAHSLLLKDRRNMNCQGLGHLRYKILSITVHIDSKAALCNTWTARLCGKPTASGTRLSAEIMEGNRRPLKTLTVLSEISVSMEIFEIDGEVSGEAEYRNPRIA